LLLSHTDHSICVNNPEGRFVRSNLPRELIASPLSAMIISTDEQHALYPARQHTTDATLLAQRR
jgi:hypothetical protein